MLTAKQLKRFEFKIVEDTTAESRQVALNLLEWLRVLPGMIEHYDLAKMSEAQVATARMEIRNFIADLEKANKISAILYIADPAKIRSLAALAKQVAGFSKAMAERWPGYDPLE